MIWICTGCDKAVDDVLEDEEVERHEEETGHLMIVPD